MSLQLKQDGTTTQEGVRRARSSPTGTRAISAFFNTGNWNRRLVIRTGDILPRNGVAEKADGPGIYAPYILDIVASPFDATLRGPRKRAVRGKLHKSDCVELNELLDADRISELLAFEDLARNNGLAHPARRVPRDLQVYALVKQNAMLIAQVLFVNNAMREGILSRIEIVSYQRAVAELSQRILRITVANGGPVKRDDADFYASLFVLQTAFDKLFVPHEDIVKYSDVRTGEYQVAGCYRDAVRYLALARRRQLRTSLAEIDLCHNLTTGWSQGIDQGTWDALNRLYYENRSPLTGRKVLFAEHYDKLLECMLPQFRLSKVQLAEEVVRREIVYDGSEPVTIVEIGAGSGAFPSDLIMACKRHHCAPERIRYVGIEPCERMRAGFRENVSRKTGGHPIPVSWELIKGSLEEFNAAPCDVIRGRGDQSPKKTIVVCCYSLHHCYAESVLSFLRNPSLKTVCDKMYMLDVVKEHGWTKPYYMWADCESPENFDNVTKSGTWCAETLWQEPKDVTDGRPATGPWCSLRLLSRPRYDVQEPCGLRRPR